MTVRPPLGLPLPELVLVANRVLTEEAEALRASLAEFSNAPQPGCPWQQDDQMVADLAGPAAQGRAELLRHTRHQAVLISANAYDHLLTLGRALGEDGAMPLFSHVSVSRVVCEAAVRFAWLMDPGISSEERIARGAVALFISADERWKGVRRLSAERLGRDNYRKMLDNCTAEREEIQDLITSAGFTFACSEKGKKTKIELKAAGVSVPIQVDVTDLTAKLLPESPNWYSIGSSLTHSLYWGLRDVNKSRPGEPPALAPDVMDVGAATESAISASGLILDRCGKCYGHDPRAQVRRTQGRREAIDRLMRRATTSTWAYIPTAPQHRAPDSQQR